METVSFHLPQILNIEARGKKKQKKTRGGRGGGGGGGGGQRVHVRT